jgi:hypothetical protein
VHDEGGEIVLRIGHHVLAGDRLARLLSML